MITQSLFDLPTTRPHPAKYTRALLPAMASMLKQAKRILDPFGGTGRIFELTKYGIQADIEAIELEPEWAAWHPNTHVGNALDLPFADNSFDAVATSPAYGNRMADRFQYDDPTRHYNTYTHQMGRTLHPDNAGQLQWGEPYRQFHIKAWIEVRRVLDGIFVLNIKNHIRSTATKPDTYMTQVGTTPKGTPTYMVDVTQWHIDALKQLGFTQVQHEKVICPGNRNGANRAARIAYESLILFNMAP